MVILVDIGNTHTHVALADAKAIHKRADLSTGNWFRRGGHRAFLRFVGKGAPSAISVCSVVPRATPHLRKLARRRKCPFFELNARTVSQVGVDYPEPGTIGPDRLANAVAARQRFGAPVVVVDFGTAVTFDVVDGRGNYVGGIIAPGLAAMTEYLHEKTALLPKIKIQDVKEVIGKSTEQAMLIGAVHGYRGMVRELLTELRKQLGAARLPVVATGGYAELVASKLPDVTAIDPDLTLEGLRLEWLARQRRD
jgi:type III pantothenate kinase